MQTVDILILGGGINGVGIARDAAGRGLKVHLCEKDDLASHTSSWSTKLIHGGLRYLEHKEFRLVRESLKEREVLLNAAPYMVRPMRFILPHHKGLRPAWLLRLGLFLYDYIGGRKLLPATQRRNLDEDDVGKPLKDHFHLGFEYTDCQVDDSRLVVVNALDAAVRGASINTRQKLVRAHRDDDAWLAELADVDGNTTAIRASAIVNAAGPWVTSLFEDIEDVSPRKQIRLVKGSHIITKRLYEHDRAYIFQNTDGRVIFSIPYINDTTLIGTTDEPYSGDPDKVTISAEEKSYLCAAASEYFASPITEDMIIGTYAGVRPLYDELGNEDASAVTRDYAFDIDDEGGAPLLSIYGGKLTTYRKLAEHALNKLQVYFPSMGKRWTRDAALPGGEMGYIGWDETAGELQQRFAFLGEGVMKRLLAAYGSRVTDVLGKAGSIDDLGRDFGHGLYQKEVDYLISREWAISQEDILCRRSKLHMLFTEKEEAALASYLNEQKMSVHS
jgi:glycerol-3-phosphate dehydrogenase